MHYQHITIRKPKNTIGHRHYCILIQKMHSLQICTKGTIFFVSTNDRKKGPCWLRDISCKYLSYFKQILKKFLKFLCWKIYAQRTMQAIFVYFLLLFISTATRGARVTSQDACWDMSISNEKIKFATHLNFDTFTLKMIRVRFRWHWMCLSS